MRAQVAKRGSTTAGRRVVSSRPTPIGWGKGGAQKIERSPPTVGQAGDGRSRHSTTIRPNFQQVCFIFLPNNTMRNINTLNDIIIAWPKATFRCRILLRNFETLTSKKLCVQCRHSEGNTADYDEMGSVSTLDS